MAQMDVDPGRVDPILDAQGLSCRDGALQLAAELRLRDDLLDTSTEEFPLFGNTPHGFDRSLATFGA